MPDDVLVKMFPHLPAAEGFLRKLALRMAPWTFDIETYDALEFPSRKPVAVNPFNPDFRVRGVAIALDGRKGAWIELNGDPTGGVRKLTAAGLAMLAPSAMEALHAAFASDAEKGAFNGSFDENGMIQAGWVPAIRNRTRDGMLALVALGDGTQALRGGLTLESAIQKLLRHEVYWEIDKSLMRDLPIEKVADGAVHDACYTHELCDSTDAMAERGEHIEWSKLLRIQTTEAINYDEDEPRPQEI